MASAIDFSQDAAGRSDSYDVCGDVARDDAPGTDDRSISDGDARQYDDAAAEPAAASDVDGLCIRAPAIDAARGIPIGRQTVGELDGMCRCVKLDIRRDERVAADRDGVAIDEGAVHVDGHVVPDMDVAPIIAEERLADRDVRADVAEQLLQDAVLLFFFLIAALVICTQQLARVLFEFQKNRVMAIIPLTSHTFFHFIHVT